MRAHVRPRKQVRLSRPPLPAGLAERDALTQCLKKCDFISTLTPIIRTLTPIISTLTPIISTLTPIVSTLTPITSSPYCNQSARVPAEGGSRGCTDSERQYCLS